jgi:uncharacterized protein (TIGR03000 family)
MLRFLTLGALSLATLLLSMSASSAQPGQQGPMWNRSSSGYQSSQPVQQFVAPAAQTQTQSESFYNGAVDNRAALLRLQVPADAKVWLDGTQMNSTGEFRSYISPSLTAGQNYSYQIRVQTSTGEQTRNVPVRSGDRITLDFRTAANQ